MLHKKSVKYLLNNFKGDVSNKTILITGANSGLGYESAKICLYLKMNVIIACRSETKGNEAIEKLKEEFPNGNVRLMILDLSEETSIINFVNRIKEEKIDIDVFYHNAGVYRLPYQIKENKELIASTNYYGPYMLTSLLLPYLHLLNHEVKMVFTSSIAAKFSHNDVSMLTPTKDVSGTIRYANSKMLDAHLFKYLYDHDHHNIKYYLVHPGVTCTSLFNKVYKNKLFASFMDTFINVFGNPLWKSALSIVRVLSGDNKPGSFYGPTHIYDWRGYPKENHFLDKKYFITKEIIKQTEIITSYMLDSSNS